MQAIFQKFCQPFFKIPIAEEMSGCLIANIFLQIRIWNGFASSHKIPEACLHILDFQISPNIVATKDPQQNIHHKYLALKASLHSVAAASPGSRKQFDPSRLILHLTHFTKNIIIALVLCLALPQWPGVL